MNTKYLWFIFLLLPFGFCQAQPALTYAGQGLTAGINDTVQAVSYIAPTESGAAQQWDFRSLSILGAPVASFTTADALGSIALNEGNQAVFLFESSANANLFKGFENAEKIVVYDQAVTKMYFPFSFGNSFQENYTAHGLYLKDTIATQMEGIYTVIADAYGSLVLPNGRAFDQALRIKTTDYYTEQICGIAETTIEKYLWYVPEYPLPVFVLAQSVSGYLNQAEHDTLQAAYYAFVPEEIPVVSPEENTPPENEEPNISLHPNPATTFIEVYSDVDISQYQLRSTSGVIYATQQVSSQQYPLRISLINTTPGWYVLNLETASGWVIRTFVIN